MYAVMSACLLHVQIYVYGVIQSTDWLRFKPLPPTHSIPEAGRLVRVGVIFEILVFFFD